MIRLNTKYIHFVIHQSLGDKIIPFARAILAATMPGCLWLLRCTTCFLECCLLTQVKRVHPQVSAYVTRLSFNVHLDV